MFGRRTWMFVGAALSTFCSIGCEKPKTTVTVPTKTAEDLKALSQGISRDMSPEAIARRLEIASQLHELVKTLGRSQKVGAVEAESGAQAASSSGISEPER